MVAHSPRRLALAASLAALATFTTAAPVSNDPCAILGHLNATDITYAHVSACYKAIPYDPKVAQATYTSVHALFNDYYVFRDSALTPDLQKPFLSAPVDIVEQLETIGQTKYTSDYQFHRDVSDAIYTLHDAHAGYNVDCYNAYLFSQPLNLYAPVTNGKQSLRVLTDLAKRGYEDCEVLTIDGQDALPYMNKWATHNIGFSKDGGVRLNQALANQIYNHNSGQFVLSSGDFAERATLPENPYIEYNLQCAQSNTPLKVRDQWVIFTLTEATFSDVGSYVNNVCYSASTGGNNSIKRELMVPPMKRHLFPVPRKSAMLDIQNATPSPNPPPGFAGADKLGEGNATVYYHLKTYPDVGVIVVFTHQAENSELDVALSALEEFHRRNVTKLIIDFQGNGGGSVSFASYIVQAFFPNKTPLDKSLRSDLRVNKLIQDLSVAVFNNSDAGLYNAAQYFDLQANDLYQSDSLFLNTVDLTRNGRSAMFTGTTTLAPSSLPDIPQLTTFPWTNNANNIRILSDGRCGSSCALSSYYFHTLNNVTAYSIGGNHGEDLSIYSFAGGAVSSLSDLNKIYALTNLTSPFGTLPYKGDISLPILEVYANGSDVPLEYDAAQYPANFHLAFDSTNARKRDVMWSQVAAHAWS
ncbi:hypothetical protein BC939DRAFT_470788 [Gamsiella multidivaricata]|uniref:uncharacterized protein n=1 Tax=Gamsiella multidivaricata TaxID=101098 RepID=UPI0022203BD4|nr:uncharacterized protein BC939DRAFT_470788 [Gamsiella multidivaricata]KAG0369166.1 hypothetical protein BGZ54_000156 [Gamsiella multidivaricata]KAI7815977.1 hypothetical protein BC939DRAFT_470788 [Gamsiella multidivaricata]